MNADISIRTEGRAGLITLVRPSALNALTYDMVKQIDAALRAWKDADLDLVVLDAVGSKAFCAGGDIADMYATGKVGDFTYGRKFWRDEYRMNARLAEFPKPVVAFLQGFTLGGGVGLGCHTSHRIVCETSQIAMPECSIGLIPDVGGTYLLAKAPGALGAYLGTTGARMGPGCAIHAGFADTFVKETSWEQLKHTLIKTGDVAVVQAAASSAPQSPLVEQQDWIDTHFSGSTIADCLETLPKSDWPRNISRNAPLAMACAIEAIQRVRATPNIRDALSLEYRATYRAMPQGDFLEGIRAAIIDRDRSPRWAHASPLDVTEQDVFQMLAPLGDAELMWET